MAVSKGFSAVFPSSTSINMLLKSAKHIFFLLIREKWMGNRNRAYLRTDQKRCVVKGLNVMKLSAAKLQCFLNQRAL